MDKKNTLLLTVIAIATLLVAVVGATFAYFTAQTGAGATANVDVKTSTVDTATMSTFDDLSINATLQNFDKDDASLTDSTQGYVEFTPSNADGRGEAKYCYTVELSIDTNEFIYSLPKTKSENNHYPELVLNVWKSADQSDKTGLDSIDTGDTNRYNQSMYIDTDNHQLFYDNDILSTGHICTDNVDYSANTGDSKCTEVNTGNKIAGYDITVVGNSSYDGGDSQNLNNVTTIKIPKKDAEYGSQLTANDYIHEIKVTGGADANAKYDLWKASVTLVNYKDTDITDETPGSGDQSKYEISGEDVTNIGNAGRKFNATLTFAKAECPEA